MANDNIDKVTSRVINLAASIKQAWGTEWAKPDVAYRFSNGREFNSTDKRDTGIYEQS